MLAYGAASKNRISELPLEFGDLKSLTYVDFCHNVIAYLPQVLTSLLAHEALSYQCMRP